MPVTNPGSSFMVNYTKFFPIIVVLFLGVSMGVFLAWFWSVVIGLQTKITEEAKMKLGRFKIFYFIPIIIIPFLVIFFETLTNGMVSEVNEIDMEVIGRAIAIILPLQLFSMFGILHSGYFFAKTFKAVELQRKVEFSDFVGEFFMIWFYPITIWIIQPKINKMIMTNRVGGNKS